MRKTKMLAALLAGLITLSLAGCGADKTENTGSDPASAESGITATATDNASEPTAESRAFPAPRCGVWAVPCRLHRLHHGKCAPDGQIR